MRADPVGSEAAEERPPMRAVAVRLIQYGADGRVLDDASAAVRVGRALSVSAATAEALKELNASTRAPGKVARIAVEVELIEEIGLGRYRYRVLSKSGAERTGCLFKCEVEAANPVLAKTIGAFRRKEEARASTAPAAPPTAAQPGRMHVQATGRNGFAHRDPPAWGAGR